MLTPTTDPPWRPEAFTIVPHTFGEHGSIKERETFTFKVAPGGGMHYEADETARCIRDGLTESKRMPLDESRVVQGWFDAIRRNGQTVLRDVKGTAGK
jgi:hypothetical protein